jgi:nifR3 family TIM-barrel protein
VRIGSLELATNLCLSPLAGYTNLPFRLVLREIGGLGLATTDLVNARSLLENRPKALKLVETRPEDRPLAVQLFGANPDEMAAAARKVEALGVSCIDINMGCPVRKVCRVGAGSAMMRDIDHAVAVARAVVNAVRIPVTAKMRLGWDAQNITAPELARALEDVGVAAVFVHGRTREQGFSGRVSLEGIRKVVEAVRTIPVIGNGDVTTPEAAWVMLQQTGCAGVSIGRGAFYDPWIFRRTWAYIRRKQLELVGADPSTFPEVPPEPSFEERVRVMRRHLDLLVEVFGEETACKMFRKIGPWYARRFGPNHEFNRRIVHLRKREEFEEILEAYCRWRQQFLDDQGNLLPRYQPPPLTVSFQETAGADAEAIPVPSGPVEYW